MRKQLFTALLATALMVTTVPMAVFADTAPTTQAGNTVAASTTGGAVTTTSSAVTTTSPAVTATGSAVTTTDSAIEEINSEAKAPDVLAPIKLTLEDAYKKMSADSPQSIAAKYTLDKELAVGKGYSESISNLNKAEKKAEDKPDAWGVDTSSRVSLQAQRKFANEQAPKNYESRMNDLKSQTYEMYYNYKYTEVQVQVAKDNLTRVQKVYDSTMLQFKVGKVSKLDTLTAETNLNDAKDNYQKAINGFEQMKMDFNLFMGYNIHQPVSLTDALTAIALPTKSVDESVKDALANRNEIAEAKYRTDITQLALNDVKDYPSSSATYKKAQVSLQMAQENLKSSPGTVEKDIRTKYMDMKQKHDAVQSGKVSYENSKETSRLGQLQFDSGFITVMDLAGMNLNTFNTQQAYFKAILDYNLAVNAYELASGAGVTPSAI